MNCTKCKELLVAYVEGLLEEPGKQSVAEHLKECASCQSEVKELTNLHDRLVRNGKALTQGDLESDVMNRIVREQNVRLKATSRATSALKIRRTIMKSPMTKIAAAAVIIIAVLIGINPFGGTITFADVVKPLLNAKTVIFDVIIGTDE
ncbi:MAG: anti-sigma factor family protein, partial [Planctomycetota bacterium]